MTPTLLPRLLGLCMAAAILCARAQEAETPAMVSAPELERQVELVSADPGLTDADREKLLSELAGGQQRLEEAKQFSDRADTLRETVENAAQKTTHFEELLAAALAEPPQVDIENAEVGEIESRITLLKAQRRSLSDRRSAILQEIDNTATRTATIRERLSELRSRMDALRSELGTPADTPEQIVAQLVNKAYLEAWGAETDSLEAELLSQPARERIRGAERAWIRQALLDLDRQLQTLAAAAERARSAAAKQELQTTEALTEKLQSTAPAVRDFANQNKHQAEELQALTRQTEAARRESARLLSDLEDIEEDAHLTKRRLEVAGLEGALGGVLLGELESLPDVAALEAGTKRRNARIAETSLAYINAEETLRELEVRREYIDATVPDFQSLSPESRALVDQLVDQRKVLLGDYLKASGTLVRLLVDTNVTADRLVQQTQDFHDFLVGNLLWVQNFSFFNLDILREQVGHLFSHADWAEVPARIAEEVRVSPPLALFALLFLPLLFAARRLKRGFQTLVSTPTKLSSELLWNIVLGILMTMLIVAPWPLLIYLCGKTLAVSEPANSFTVAVGPAIMFTGQFMYVLLFTRLMVNKLGVGRRFLKWDARMLDALRGELDWAAPTLIAARFVEVFAINLDVVASGGLPLGAIAALVEAFTVIVLCLRLLRQEIFRTSRMVALLLRIAVALGTGIVILQVFGLLFAAEMYLEALGLSLILLLVVKTLGDVLKRWLLIIRARLERRAREGLKAQEELGSESGDGREELTDVESLSEAHRQLLALARLVTMAVALWLIWSPSLPALNFLDNVTLWQVTDSSVAETGMRSITLFDLTLSVFILGTTALIARHVPSLVQVFMLEWARISAGARYASSILLQYMVIAIGTSLFLATVGWDWSRVQWLVAALGVGIGFGLQEIVANFISGLIILFERPIRVGDIITAGEAEGVVKEIKPRATIIETFDRKEHLVPNKELITGHVINWSLSDTAVRIVIPVGVAYGSDVRGALELLLEAAREEPLILPDPEPMATFEDFADSALLLWLRCYASEERPLAFTRLRLAINDKFAAAGIEISFPQQDVHLDLNAPIEIAMRERAGNAPPGDTP